MSDNSEIMKFLESIESACNECGGNGFVKTINEEKLFCECCDGTGYMLTHIGQRVMPLIERTLARLSVRADRRQRWGS